ncbi:MAG: hypothetical protein OXG36_02815, partial [Caldilineaceae bacterium]|nr:hypothetical protein [Caldilineaceae bacterium]
MKMVVRGVLLTQACLLMLGILAPETFANQHLFDDYVDCPTKTRGAAPSGLMVYRTAQPGQLLVTWNRVDVDAWRLHGDTARIVVVVEGAAASQVQYTPLWTSRTVFEDVVGPGSWWAYVAVLNGDHVISRIGVREFGLSALELESDWDRVHRFRRRGLWEPTRSQVKEAILPAESGMVHMGPYDDPERHAQGLFHLVREETRVTATFSSAGSAVTYAAGPDSEPLFTVPVGFRPRTMVTRDVEGWPVTPGSVAPTGQIPIRFRVQIAPNGDVGYVDGPALAGVERLAYMLTVQWTTTDVIGDYIAGTYGLQRRGRTVHMRLRSTRSSLGPEILFTVPEGFRPESPIMLAAPEVWLVPDTGPLIAIEAPELTFQLRITPAGTVHHVRNVSTTGADDDKFVAYALDVTWKTIESPLPETAAPVATHSGPGVCGRHLVVQGALLEALGRGHRAGPACATVTWAELARVNHLALTLGLGHAPLQRRDFAGLSGLTSLSLETPDLMVRWWPSDLLAEVPTLENLHLDLRDGKISSDLSIELDKALMQALPLQSDIEVRNSKGRHYWLPPDLIGNRVRELLGRTPRLRRLTLEGNFPELPADLLAATPHLRRLTLRNRGWFRGGSRFYPNSWRVNPEGLLDPIPGLTHLTLQGRFVDLVPEFLEPVPHLQHLVLQGGQLPHYEVLQAMLVATPNLQHLSLVSDNWFQPPADLLEAVPRLRSLRMVFGHIHPKNQFDTRMRLPIGFLAPVPRLTRLTLFWDWSIGDDLPRDLLHHTPDLLELTVSALHPTEDFLQFVPHLRELRGPVVLTPATVVPPPQVQPLAIHVPGSWSEELVAKLSRVTALELLFDCGYAALPQVLLGQLP